MNPSTLLVILAQTGAILAVGLVSSHLLRRLPAVRLAVGRLTILSAIALVALSPWLGERPSPVVPVAWNPAPAAQPNVISEQTKPDQPDASHADSAPAASVATPIDLTNLPIWLWAAGVAVLSAHLGLGYAALAKLRRSSLPVDDAEVLEAVTRAAKAAGVRTPRILESAEVGNPFVAGVWRPTIYLPPVQAMGDEAIESVVRHEVAHIANGDLRWSFLHRISCILLWPQALLWIMRKPLSEASEELCDRQVLASGVPSTLYAKCLLSLRESVRARPHPALGIGAVTRVSGLARRIESVLDPKGSRAIRVSRTVSALTWVGAIVLAGGSAYLFATPSQAASLQDSELKDWLLKPYDTVVNLATHDGKPVTGAKAWLILTGNLPEQKVVPLQVDGSKIAIKPGPLPLQTSGTLFVTANGYGFAAERLWPSPRKITGLSLEAPVRSIGKIRLPNGAPAAGLKVVPTMFVNKTHDGYVAVALNETMQQPFATRTNDSGEFVLSGLSTGYTVAVDVQDDRFARTRFSDRFAVSPAAAAKEIQLQEGATVSGVVARDGKPVAGIKIGAQENHEKDRGESKWGDAFTDSQGRYSLKRLQPGVYNIAPDLRGGMDAEVTAVAHEAVEVTTGQIRENLNFALIPGAIIEGQVRDQSGKPVPDMYVGVYGPAHPRSSAWVQQSYTDSAGKFRFRVPAGEQYVYAADARFDVSGETITIRDGSQTRIDLTVRPAKERPMTPAIAVGEAEADAEPEVDDSKPTPAVMSFGEGRPFYGPARLKNGGTARLAFIQDPSLKPALWSPDGSAASPADLKRALHFGGERGGHVRSLYARVDVEGIRRGDYDCVVQVPQPSRWTVWQSYGDMYDNTLDLATFRAAPTLKVTDMRFGIASGPYKTVSRGALGEGPLQANVSGAESDPSLPESSVTISVVFPPELEAKSTNLVVYGRRGPIGELAYVTSTERGRRRYGFSGISASDIARVELQAREYEWVTFKGIRLYPNAQTRSAG